MSDNSAIEWTNATWNPTTGCDRVSPGCANCYALDLAARLKKMGASAYQADGDPKTSGPGFALTMHPDRLDIPLRWTRPRRIFVNSMSDLFHPDVPDEFIDRVFSVAAWATRHTYQVLTKRPERMRDYFARQDQDPYASWVTLDRQDAVYDAMCSTCMDTGGRLCRFPGDDCGLDNMAGWPLPNVWLGTSVENDRWTSRIDALRDTPAAVRFLSCEPLLGPLPSLDLAGIGWVIVGGESGPNHRPIDPGWVRAIRDRCVAAGVPFFLKQWGGRRAGGEARLDGREWKEFPDAAH